MQSKFPLGCKRASLSPSGEVCLGKEHKFDSLAHQLVWVRDETTRRRPLWANAD